MVYSYNIKTDKIKENQQAGLNSQIFGNCLPLGYIFYNWIWVKTQFAQQLLNYQVTKTWGIKNVNCKAKQTIHREFMLASE